MTVRASTAAKVRRRAAFRCEYCRMHQALQGAEFHIEHILPDSRGGSSTLDNLALACPGCNLRKADRVEVPDPDSLMYVLLFHPRKDKWTDHFGWYRYRIRAKTAVGRATIDALQLNHPRRIAIRKMEESYHLFPP